MNDTLGPYTSKFFFSKFVKNFVAGPKEFQVSKELFLVQNADMCQGCLCFLEPMQVISPSIVKKNCPKGNTKFFSSKKLK